MPRIAALDLGSNSFHLLVADARPAGRLQRAHTRKITLRLAELVADRGELGAEGRGRAADGFAELLEEAREHGAERVVAVATEALRSAGDGRRLQDELERRHGVPVRLLSGDEEAALSLRAMAAALHVPDVEPLLGVDLGGGSYDLAFGMGGEAEVTASLPLGAARLGDRLVYDPPRLAERAALHAAALELLEPFARKVAGRLAERDATVPRAVGTAGTIRDLGRLGLALAGGRPPERIRGLAVTRGQLERAYARLVSVPTPERVELPGVSAKRADLLPAGGIVLLATMQACRLEQIQLCDWGLREGALLDAAQGGGVLGPDDFASL
jgi:exopolyphosphatase / guanosine-5'-triphosphate,3'-diphosphate pyrophosphatase